MEKKGLEGDIQLASGRAIAQALGPGSVANVYDNVVFQNARIQLSDEITRQLLEERVQLEMRPNAEELFCVVSDPAQLFDSLFSASRLNLIKPLDLPYVKERTGVTDVCAAMERQLNEAGSILIWGRTGLGKTRAIAELMTTLLANGWTAYIYDSQRQQLTLPRSVSLKGVKKIALVIDNLETAAHDERAFRQWLKSITQMFGQGRLPSDIRIILACKSEPHFGLGFEVPFGDSFALPEFTAEGLRAILSHLNDRFNLGISEDELAGMVQESDGTPSMLLEKLELARKHNRPLNLRAWREMRLEDWSERFPRVCRQNQDAIPVLSALLLLHSAGLRTVRCDVYDLARELGAQSPEHAVRDLINNRIIGDESQTLRIFGSAQLISGLAEAGGPGMELLSSWALIAKVVERRADRSRNDSDFKSLALALVSAGHIAQGIEVCNRAITTSEHPGSAYVTRGLLQLVAGCAAEAKMDIRQAIESGPEQAENYFLMGLADMIGGQTTDAEASFGKAMQLESDREDFLLAHAIVCWRLGRGRPGGS